MSHRRQLLLLLFVALATYLVGNARVSLWDRDEPRYAQTSRQMLDSGDWVVPRLYDVVRTKKPPLIYWCQAISMKIFGEFDGMGAAAARLPSALAMTATLALVATYFGGQRGILTALILGTGALVFWSAKSALTDSVLLLFITTTQLGVLEIYRGNRSWRVIMITVAAIGLGGLTKGPIVVAIPGLTILALVVWRVCERRTVTLRVERDAILPGILKGLVAIAMIVAIVAPWLILVEHRSPGFLRQAIFHEVVDRARDPQEGHSGPPGYYLLTIWGMYFPWSLLLPGALVVAWRRRENSEVRFALAAVVGPWIFLEIYRTKLPHYLLPAYPFLALMTADLLIDAAGELTGRIFKRVVTGWSVVVALLGLAPWVSMIWFPLSIQAMFGLAAFSIIAIYWASQIHRTFVADQPVLAATIMGVGMFALIAALHIGFLADAEFLQTSRRLASLLEHHTGKSIMIDYKEPSLAFYQGGTIREEQANDYLETAEPWDWPQWIVITDSLWQKVPADRRPYLNEIGKVRGLDTAGKGIVDVVVLRRN